ncbi:MAG: hypothetical protein AAFS03_11720, partial [Pseudomonadota bacterium]
TGRPARRDRGAVGEGEVMRTSSSRHTAEVVAESRRRKEIELSRSPFREGRYRYGDSFVNVKLTVWPTAKWHYGDGDAHPYKPLTPEVWADLTPFTPCP